MRTQRQQLQERRASSRGVFGTSHKSSTMVVPPSNGSRGSIIPVKVQPSQLLTVANEDSDDPYAISTNAQRMMMVKPPHRMMTSAFVQRRGTEPRNRSNLMGTFRDQLRVGGGSLQPSVFDTDASILAKRCRIREALEKIKGDQIRVKTTMKNKRSYEPLVATKQQIFNLDVRKKTRNDKSQTHDSAKLDESKQQVSPLIEQQMKTSSQPSGLDKMSFDLANNTKSNFVKSTTMDNFDLRNRNQTRKILVTDVNKYLDEDNESPHKNCISCAKCLAIKRKVLQFKYSKQLKSTYRSEIEQGQDRSSSPIPNNSSAAHKNQNYNYDAIKRQLRVAYEPPRQMVSNYTNNFVNTKGTEMIGALDQEGKKAEPSRDRKVPSKLAPPDLPQEAVPLKFQALSQNAMTYAGSGRLPTPNKRGNAQLTTGFGRFYGETSYGSNFDNKQDTAFREGFLVTRTRVKDHRARHQKGSGSLSPPRQLPNIVHCAAAAE